MTRRNVYIPRNRRSNALQVAAATAALALSFTAGFLWPVKRSDVYRIEADTRSGNLYIAGMGATCRDAWNGAVFPHDWTRLVCRKAP